MFIYCVTVSFTNKIRKGDLMNTIMICSATIATVFGQPIEIMTTEPQSDNPEIYVVTYKRPDDGTVWVNKCKVEGDRVIWGAIDGRWRTHNLDSKITFSESETHVTITEIYSDGSATTKQYPK